MYITSWGKFEVYCYRPCSGQLMGNLRKHRGVLTRPHLLNTHFNTLFTSLNFIGFWHLQMTALLFRLTHTHWNLFLQSSRPLISLLMTHFILIYKSTWLARLNHRNSVCKTFWLLSETNGKGTVSCVGEEKTQGQ